MNNNGNSIDSAQFLAELARSLILFGQNDLPEILPHRVDIGNIFDDVLSGKG
jgi:hypothetical protein